MKSSDFLLLFFIIYDAVITIIYLFFIYHFRKEYNKIDKYNEELFFEVAKLRQKCYSKNKEE